MAHTSSTLFTWLAAILLLGTVMGCGDRNPVNKNTDDVIIPLKVGNSWTYRSTDPVIATEYTWQIDSIGNIGSTPWFFSKRSYASSGRMDNGPTLRNDGGSALFYNANLLDRIILQLKYPGNVGELFKYDTIQGLADGLEATMAWTITSTDTVITVPAGTFTCYLYRQTQIMPSISLDAPLPLYVETHIFAAPDVGIIRYDDYNYGYTAGDSSNLSRRELVDYHLE